MDAVVALDLAPHDLGGLGRVLDVVGVLVGNEGDLATENGLIELKRRAGVAAKVQVRGGGDGHGCSFVWVIGFRVQ